MRNIAIIGGGASGIAAAITAAEAGARVTLFEAGKRIGHSILVSGNGRCNWSNATVKPADYTNAEFVARAFSACPPQRVWDWFADLGLLWTEESAGRLYPQANKASSVLDVLRFRLEELGVVVACETPVVNVRPAGSRWAVGLQGGRAERFDAVLVACGGSIARSLLPDGYRFAKPAPRLCPIRTALVPHSHRPRFREGPRWRSREGGGGAFARPRDRCQAKRRDSIPLVWGFRHRHL